MKKSLFTLLLIYLSAHNVFSQKNSSLSLSIGPSLPTGEYANKDGNDPSSGLAKVGGVLDLSYMHTIGHSGLGFTAMLRARANGISSSAVLETFEKQYPDYQWSTKKRSYKTAAVLAGAYYHFAVTKRIDLKGELMLGAAESWLPDYTITGVRDTGVNNIVSDFKIATSNKRNAWSFSGMVKIGMAYKLTNKFSLIAGLDFWYLKPTFKKLTRVVASGDGLGIPGLLWLNNAAAVQVNSYTADYTQNMSSLNLTFGLSMAL